MKRFLVLFGLCVFLTGLLVLGSNSSVHADEPEEPQGIPRHRVGHRAKVQDLDSLLAQNDGGDPLAGNYRLVADDEIFLASRHPSGTTTNWRAYDVDDDLDDLGLMDESFFSGSKSAVATGYFRNNDLTDFVFLWTDGNRKIHMDVGYFKNDLSVNQASFDTGETVYSSYPPRVATGDVDGDGQDEIVMAWLGGDGTANVKIYDPEGGIHPVAKDKRHDKQVANGNLDIATGDFNGDGDDEVVLVWVDSGNIPAAKIYDVDHDGKLYPKDMWKGGSGQTLAVATGDFNNDGREEIAVVDGYYLRIFQVSDDLSALTRKGETIWFCDTNSSDESLVPVDVAAGDFNTDGQDEIVATCNAYNMKAAVWASGSDLKLHHKASWSKSMDDGHYTYEGSLAVGDVNRDLRAEIVVAWAQWNDPLHPSEQHNYAQVLQVATDLGSIHAKGQLDLGEAPQKSYLAVAVGDLNGDSLRAGPPTYSQVTGARQLLAVVNEPPKHHDVLGGVTYDVNNNTDTYASYEDSHKQSTEMSLTTTRDWGLSTELEADAYGVIHTSLKVSYGESFEKTTSSFKEMSFGQTAWAQSDDVIIRTETNFDVWEYPVYSDVDDTVQGHIVVTFPRKRDSNCSDNCETSVINSIDGKIPTSYYTPNHENGNLLSYSTAGPKDIAQLLKANSRNTLGTNPYEYWVVWSDVESDEDKRTTQLDVAIGAGVEYWGIKADVEGTYAKGEVSTQNVSFENSTSIHVYYAGIDAKYSYWVEPYIYWSSTSGHLVVNYAAGPVTATPATWWQNTYTKPDPTFNLPWKYDPPTPAYRALSKEITFDPPSPTAGDVVTVTAKVRNYSLVGVDNVKVRFYRGDPDDGGVPIGADQNIPQLNGMSSHTVEVLFDTKDYGGETLSIYAVVDPDKAVEEMHEDYNKAYALLPVKPKGSSAVRPTNLAIASENIFFDPATPDHGETVHISASVEAWGDAFTHVTVEFWDGAPDDDGRIIGGEIIPMILADETGTAHIAWQSSGAHGPHEIWVGVGYQAGKEDLSTDNWAHQTINLLPHHFYLPLLLQGP